MMAAPIYVLGHRNPDSDSVCAAIGYAALMRDKGCPEAVAARQLHVPPAQVAQLTDSQAAEHQGGQHRPSGDVLAVLSRLEVKLAGGVEQRLYLVRSVEPHRGRTRDLQLAPLRVDAHRITRHELTLLGHVENLAEQLERPVDRLGTELCLPDLVISGPIYPRPRDLRQTTN